MDRRALLVLALVVTALLVPVSANAYADPATEQADSAVTLADAGTPATVTDPAPPATTLPDATTSTTPEGGAPASPPPAVAPATPPPATTSPPPPPAGVPAPPPAPSTPNPAADTTPVSGPVLSIPAPATPARSAPAVVEVAPAAPAAAPPVAGLQRVLPAVERDLRGVRADVEAIRRRLDEGAAPPAGRLSRLRSRLHQLAPVLRSLEARVDAVARPSQELQQLIHRVQGRLAATQASTAGLIVALRRSGLDGPEVRGLLRELESFRTLGIALGPIASAVGRPAPFAPLSIAPDLHAAITIEAPSTPAAVEPASQKPSAAPPATGGATKAAGHHAPAPAPVSSGSSSAGPGGALSVAGLASLAALLIALVLPRLLTRLELAPGRSHSVAFALALERPD